MIAASLLGVGLLQLVRTLALAAKSEIVDMSEDY